jgi:hypothetical protein
MLPLHRLESRRQRKPLGKIGFLSLFFITALDSLKPEGGECFQPWTVLNNEPPVALLTGQIGETRQILYAAVLG